MEKTLEEQVAERLIELARDEVPTESSAEKIFDEAVQAYDGVFFDSVRKQVRKDLGL